MVLPYVQKAVQRSTRCYSLSAARRANGGLVSDEKAKEKSQSSAREIPSSADVVVIGGGSLGCSTLYSLAKLGVTNTVLLESHQLTAGTTWHTAGLLWKLKPNDTEVSLLTKTIDTIRSLEDETGVDPGWINNGGLFIAKNKNRLEDFKRMKTVGDRFGVQSFLLDRAELKKIYPLMNISDVYGALYNPEDGTIEPAGLCDSLTRYATKRGAKVYEHCPVLDINTESTLFGGKQVKEVVTPLGTIKTTKIVNATGCWGNDITKKVGVTIPLVPMKHAYVVTEKIPGIENMPNVRDYDASYYLRLQGDALSVGGYEPNPIFLDEVSKDSPFGLFELDWNVFSVIMEGAINRVPNLERTGIKSTVCGPESFTPDHKPIMGEDPNVDGFFHCCGFNSAGMMFGGGCGNQMAHWVTKGRPELDMFSFDIRRFNPTSTRDKTWVVPRCHEAYAKNYSIPYPHDEPLAGRGQNKDPLHDILVREGCVFQERHGWERPGWFNSSEAPVPPYDWYGYYDNELAPDNRYKNALTADYTFDNPPHHDIIGKECLAARTKAALFNMSYFGQIFISGPDAQKAADWLFTANMQRDVGAVVYTCMLNEQGGAEADLTVGILEGSESCPWEPQFEDRGFYLAIGGAATLQNKAHVLKQCRLHGWDVTLTDRTDDMGLLSLQGPKSREILQQVTDADLSNEGFPFSTHKIIDVAGHKVRAIRLSFVGELGWEMHVPFEASIPVYQALRSAGEKFGLVNGGYRALDSLSLEKGYVHWHGDLRADDTPLEAGLGFACKLKTSTPFLGRAALEKQKEEKIRKKLVTFTVNDPTVSIFGMEGLLRNGEHVGLTRRGEYAFYLEEVVARGYVQMPCKGPITKEFLSTGDWEIDVRGDKYPITVHTKQPFDPKNQRVKGVYEN